MASRGVPQYVSGLDTDDVQVGKPVVTGRAQALADMIHHMFQIRRRTGIVCAYQVDQSNVSRGMTDTEHWWEYLAGPTSNLLRVRALTLGAEVGATSGIGSSVHLTVETSTTAAVDWAYVSEAPDPDETLRSPHLNQHTTTIAVTPSNDEEITIDQTHASKGVRILALSVEEAPSTSIDTVIDAGYCVDTNLFASGSDIIATTVDDLPLALTEMRKTARKVLFSCCKLVTTTSTTNDYDMYTGSAVNHLRWNIAPSVDINDETTVPVRCYIVASHSDSDGYIKCQFNSSYAEVHITSSTPAMYSVDDDIDALDDTVSIQIGDDNAAGTLSLYSVVIVERPLTK